MLVPIILSARVLPEGGHSQLPGRGVPTPIKPAQPLPDGHLISAAPTSIGCHGQIHLARSTHT